MAKYRAKKGGEKVINKIDMMVINLTTALHWLKKHIAEGYSSDT